jgi:TRAP-type C4-dicarboxylate transport system permease small subunit
LRFDPFINRFVAAADLAAALFLAAITILTFAEVFMRYVVGQGIPDAFDLGRLLLCVALFWGLAGCCQRGEHIQVDVLWEMLSPRWRKVLDLFAVTMTAVFMIGLTWMTLKRVESTRDSGQVTFDLLIELWPFYALAWLGALAGTLMLVSRYAQILRRPDPET